MTNKTLFTILRWIILFFLALLGIGAFLFVASDSKRIDHKWYLLYKDLTPLFIALPAAYLTYAFQQRASYLSALRNFWDSLIPAIQQAIQYTHLENPTEASFAVTMKDLATVIDSLRGVFLNIPTSDPVGLYPYENLKDIVKVISWLGYASNRSDHDRYWARRSIRLLWASTHQAMLQEFDREIPRFPVGKYVDDRASVADTLIAGELTDKEFQEEEDWQRQRLIRQCS